jgi:hypothetical protein
MGSFSKIDYPEYSDIENRDNEIVETTESTKECTQKDKEG